MSITKYGTGISWLDKSLQNRSKINATIENVDQSFLHLKIVACNVERTDEATYYCDLSAIEEDNSVYQRSSEQISLNITGKVPCVGYNYFQDKFVLYKIFSMISSKHVKGTF